VKKLIIVRGLPGSGKSTYARRLVEEGQAHVVAEADDYFTDEDGSYNFDPAALQQAHSYCQIKCETWLNLDLTVVVANTFTKEWEIAPYRAIAKRTGAELEIITMRGNYGSIHGVPDEVIKKMVWDFFPATEPYCIHSPCSFL